MTLEVEHPRIIFYDGVCGLCNKTVRLLVRLDRDRKFRYAPLQGELGSALRAERDAVPEGLDSGAEPPTAPKELAPLDSFVYLEEGRAYLRSRALVRAARQLRYPWKLASWLWIIPWPLTDLVYRLVAKLRYRIWGKYDECRIPTPEERELFID